MTMNEQRNGMELRTLLFMARRAKGLTQRALAAKVGVPQSTVARIERGTIDPRASTLDRLFRACELELTVQRWSRDANGVDRTLIRGALQRTPRERVISAATFANGVDQLRAGLRR